MTPECCREPYVGLHLRYAALADCVCTALDNGTSIQHDLVWVVGCIEGLPNTTVAQTARAPAWSAFEERVLAFAVLAT